MQRSCFPLVLRSAICSNRTRGVSCGVEIVRLICSRPGAGKRGGGRDALPWFWLVLLYSPLSSPVSFSRVSFFGSKVPYMHWCCNLSLALSSVIGLQGLGYASRSKDLPVSAFHRTVSVAQLGYTRSSQMFENRCKRIDSLCEARRQSRRQTSNCAQTSSLVRSFCPFSCLLTSSGHDLPLYP